MLSQSLGVAEAFTLQALGIGIGVTAAIVFRETAPERPEYVEGEGQLQSSLALFNYAKEVKQFTDTEIARVSGYTFVYITACSSSLTP